jgi:hypothetical protein
MKCCCTKSSLEIENLVVDFIKSHGKCSVEEIADGIGYQYMAVYRILEGRIGSRSLVGLVNSGAVKTIPGINSNNGRLCWLYEVV